MKCRNTRDEIESIKFTRDLAWARFTDSYKFIGRFYEAMRNGGNMRIFIKDDVFIPRSRNT